MKKQENKIIENNKLVVFNPKHQFSKSKSVTVLRVVIDEEFTRVDFLYWAIKNYNNWKSISIESDCFIRELNSDIKLKLIKAENIPVSPYKRFLKNNLKLLNFSLYFPPLPKNVLVFDLVEKETKNENYFNFYKINLNKNKKIFYIYKN